MEQVLIYHRPEFYATVIFERYSHIVGRNTLHTNDPFIVAQIYDYPPWYVNFMVDNSPDNFFRILRDYVTATYRAIYVIELYVRPS